MTGTASGNAPVVAGVDGSASALQAVRWAAAEAARRRVRLRLLNATVDPQGGWVGFEGVGLPQEYFEEQRRLGREQLGEALHAAHEVAPDLDIATELRYDTAARALVEISGSARMVVVGSRGLGGLATMLLGSTAAAVATHATCPVVVVRAQPDAEWSADGPVVVGIDGSPTSEAAIAWAFDAASRRSADLLALHVWNDTATQLGMNWFNWDATHASEQSLLAERLAGWREKYPDVPVTPVVYPDRPVRALLEQAPIAQLMVVGSRGRGGFTGLLLGSTSRALLQHCPCPLMVVRAGLAG